MPNYNYKNTKTVILFRFFFELIKISCGSPLVTSALNCRIWRINLRFCHNYINYTYQFCCRTYEISIIRYICSCYLIDSCIKFRNFTTNSNFWLNFYHTILSSHFKKLNSTENIFNLFSMKGNLLKNNTESLGSKLR